MSNFKPVLNQNDTPYYVSQSEFIKFISENSDMKWNRICDFVIEEGILSPDGEPDLFINDSSNPEYSNENQTKWIGAFFEAHPWISKMKVVFDD